MIYSRGHERKIFEVAWIIMNIGLDQLFTIKKIYPFDNHKVLKFIEKWDKKL